MKNLIIKLDERSKLDKLYNKTYSKLTEDQIEEIKNGGFIFDEYTLIFEIGKFRFLSIKVNEIEKTYLATFISTKSYTVSFKIDERGEVKLNKEESTLYQYHLKKGLTEDEIDEIITRSITSIYDYYISIKIIIMAFSMFRKGKHYEERTERNGNVNVVKSVKTNGVSQNNSNDIKLFYEPKSCSATGNKHYKDREYVMTDWYRRGHYRHYKNGKVVYVKPHQVKSNEDVDRDYIFEG